ncbi:hypothetical protein SESBI_11178 [Sesbania bispinosa]|nr:hypothetical protein SESBI_11178 [Sesbania bispinosa]
MAFERRRRRGRCEEENEMGLVRIGGFQLIYSRSKSNAYLECRGDSAVLYRGKGRVQQGRPWRWGRRRVNEDGHVKQQPEAHVTSAVGAETNATKSHSVAARGAAGGGCGCAAAAPVVRTVDVGRESSRDAVTVKV